MFERYTEAARLVVIHAQEEARVLPSAQIGTGHLLLGVLRAVPLLLPLRAEDVRARLGAGDAPETAQLPFTEAAKRALEAAPQEAERLAHARVAPGHLLLALAADPQAAELSGLDPARLRDEALRHLIVPPERFDLEGAVREGPAGPGSCASRASTRRPFAARWAARESAHGVVRPLCGNRAAMARGPAGTLVDWPMACQHHPIGSSSRRF
jgi:Clp amino terminal domain, pathogenicity island component